ncbi:MAG TPA: hypothetical protein VN258_11960 [Mobilitalea sp.]|nr:hypothetical protein [Mobilitalea sp.]
MLLDGKGPEDFSEDFLQKVNRIALFDWKEGLPRNIRAIIYVADIFGASKLNYQSD